jgi:hypothetical protein
MDAAQLQDLINGVRGGGNRKRTVPFKTVDGLEWQTWRKQFEHIARGNGWNNIRARNEIASAMEGEAARVVEDIPPGDVAVAGGADAEPYAGLLDAYEARFITVGDADTAKVVFRTSRQQSDEGIVTWHARARQLFRRAYPALDAAAVVEASDVLIDKYVRGLYHPAVMEHVMDHRPANYGDALAQANTKAATLRNLRSVAKKSMRGEPSAGIHAFGEKMDFTCFFCSKKGHMQRSCPDFIKAVKEFQMNKVKKDSPSGRKPKKPFAASGKKKMFRKKGPKKTKSVNAVDGGKEDDGSEDDEGEPSASEGEEEEEEEENSEAEESDASGSEQGN